MQSITVFCGASSGDGEVYNSQAKALGKVLAQRGIRVIYGGAHIGVMGAVAEGALEAGGLVTGVIPKFLQSKEVAHQGLSEMIIVDTMHERKMKMQDLCDGFIALPGGFGTLEELFEVLTWAQLGLHQKPIALLNTNGYYDSLIAMIDTMIDRAFLKVAYRQMLLVSNDINDLLRQMENYKAPEVEKWITHETT
ncbi:MAG: Rossman fold protein family [Bacteroidetes bacterium]|nr:Rossman fold protein family [Bacteroidota bacterium]